MSEGAITRVVKIDGQLYKVGPRGGLRKVVDKTDYARLATMTEADIDAAIADDPDAAPLSDAEWFARARLARPRKDIVTLRIDHDVVEWFRSQGEGYQTRINEVLRTFVEHQRAAAAGKAKAAE